MIFAKRGVYVLSEDCNSMGNLSLYVGLKKHISKLTSVVQICIRVNIHFRCVLSSYTHLLILALNAYLRKGFMAH